MSDLKSAAALQPQPITNHANTDAAESGDDDDEMPALEASAGAGDAAVPPSSGAAKRKKKARSAAKKNAAVTAPQASVASASAAATTTVAAPLSAQQLADREQMGELVTMTLAKLEMRADVAPFGDAEVARERRRIDGRRQADEKAASIIFEAAIASETAADAAVATAAPAMTAEQKLAALYQLHTDLIKRAAASDAEAVEWHRKEALVHAEKTLVFEQMQKSRRRQDALESLARTREVQLASEKAQHEAARAKLTSDFQASLQGSPCLSVFNTYCLPISPSAVLNSMHDDQTFFILFRADFSSKLETYAAGIGAREQENAALRDKMTQLLRLDTIRDEQAKHEGAQLTQSVYVSCVSAQFCHIPC